MQIKFTKMHGLGNDFVVLNGIDQKIEITLERARRLADRHFGVGCDQVLLVERAAQMENDFRYRIWNSDGGEVEQCGNGARCFARFVRDKGLTDKQVIRVETMRGVIILTVVENGEVTVDMGVPVFEAAKIPFIATSSDVVQPLDVSGSKIDITAISMGNPHAVQIVPDVDTALVTTQGPLIENHQRFPQRVNAGYMQIVDRSHIKLRVWERGAGETLACGTGACAAVVAGIKRELLDSTVSVSMRGGTLSIFWGGRGPVMMTGPAETVFEGEITL